MIQTLSDKLLTLFNTLKGTNKPFVSVYDYHTLENEGYPYLCFEPVDFTAEILDNCTNLRTYAFNVIIFQEITNNGRQEAKEIITKSMDDVINLLDKNYTLGLSNVKMVNPVGGVLEPFTIQNGKALVATLRIEIQTYNSVL